MSISLKKTDRTLVAFEISEGELFVRAGVHVEIDGKPLPISGARVLAPEHEAGRDYAVIVNDDGFVMALPYNEAEPSETIGGYHFAPGGNAPARTGGDDVPAINPFSIWDIGFRPACPDPRGMTLVDGRFWVDIYLLGANHHTDGTSRFGVEIADGLSLVDKPDGAGKYDEYELTHDAATKIMAAHGKGLLSIAEFFAAARGVTERTSFGRDPKVTGLDAPRTSMWGLMQATGNMWIRGHCGDEDEPWPYLFGAAWGGGSLAGSRASNWSSAPWYSFGLIGARGRSDHLILG